MDVTVAMAYAMLSTYGKANRGISAAAAMLRGYHSVNPLLDIEKKHLVRKVVYSTIPHAYLELPPSLMFCNAQVLLVACRLACSVTLGAYSYQQNPENKYLVRTLCRSFLA